MKAIILCAGTGTKLYPITKDRPKTLLPVGDRPILDRILDRVRPIDEVDTIYVVTNDRFYPQFKSWHEQIDDRSRIELVNDGTDSPDEGLGAIGDVRYVIQEKEIQDDLLIIAGDNLLEFDLSDFISFFHEKGTVVALKEMEEREVGNYSVVETTEDDRVVDFQEKPAVPKRSTISIGLYLFQQKHLIKIRDYVDEGMNPDEPGYLIQWLYNRVPVYGFLVDGPWYDIGDITSYNEANQYIEEAK